MLTPAFVDGPVTVYQGDVLPTLRELPDESVHCVVTSPPYWALRDYGSVGQLGLEPTPEEYVEHMVAVFRELRRVLRRDGTCWLNMGDGYAGSWGAQGRDGQMATRSIVQARSIENHPKRLHNTGTIRSEGLKPKDLIGMPWRLAFALQADGWWLRSDIIWAKPNPMPESVTDRPTNAHEHIFLLTRSARYYYDAEAVREPTEARLVKMPDGWDTGKGGHGTVHRNGREAGRPDNATIAGRNLRNVWEIATEPYPDAHFATFPQAIPLRCIKAGTSEHGVCSVCGAPWQRVVETSQVLLSNGGYGKVGDGNRNPAQRTDLPIDRTRRVDTTLGWQPTCTHEVASVPSTILDPFAGSGTTLAVARRLGRRSIGIELNPSYVALIQRRVGKSALPLLEAIDNGQTEIPA